MTRRGIFGIFAATPISADTRTKDKKKPYVFKDSTWFCDADCSICGQDPHGVTYEFYFFANASDNLPRATLSACQKCFDWLVQRDAIYENAPIRRRINKSVR